MCVCVGGGGALTTSQPPLSRIVRRIFSEGGILGETLPTGGTCHVFFSCLLTRFCLFPDTQKRGSFEF